MDKIDDNKWISWKKFISDGQYGIPKDIEVEICQDTSASVVSFNKMYSRVYFDRNRCPSLKKPDAKVFKTNTKSKWIEEKIYRNWEDKDSIDIEDVFMVLAWKAGQIVYEQCAESEKNDGIVYKDSWIIGKSIKIPYQNKVEWGDFCPFAEDIVAIRDGYRKDKNDSKAWEKLLTSSKKYSLASRGIGTVYLLTLLHFITSGNNPIYDRFAMSALVVWRLSELDVSVPIDTVIRGWELPEKESAKATRILTEGKYAEYNELLRVFCEKKFDNPEEWVKNRNVDRALFVYGHLFQVK